jgi:F-box and WD-40 domain protein 1/11
MANTFPTDPRQGLLVPDRSHNDTPSTSSASAYSHDTAVETIEKASSESARPTNANSLPLTRSASTAVPWRRHPKAQLLAAEESESAIDESTRRESHEDGPRSNTSLLKGKFRRASLGLMFNLHRRDRRCSEPVKAHEEYPTRPSTSHSAWHRLRQAASFRHARTRGNGLDTIYAPLDPSVPVPGHGLEPPIIPSNTGGAAKAAAAAYHNEFFAARQRDEWFGQTDRESGIGISIVNTDEVDSRASTLIDDCPVTKVDFIYRLPSELAIQVLSHLDATHITAAARVSKTWHRIAQDQQIWRQSFLREKTTTFATNEPIQPGKGFGIPAMRPGNDWQNIYRAKQELEQKWREGTSTRPVYLNGHLDSIYCLQFDEYVLSLLL